MGRQVPGSALYRPDNPVENVLATDAVAVDIATQGIGIEWNGRLSDAPLATRRPSSGTLTTLCACDHDVLLIFWGDTRLLAVPSYRRKKTTVPTKARVPPAKLARAVERLRHHLYRLHQGLAPPPIAMVELTLGAWVSQAVQVAAELGIADALAQGPLPLDQLANRVGADADALKRLMRALISRGVFRQHRDGRYGLTPLADTLRSDAPVSMSGWARFIGSPQHREHWSLLVESVRTGKTIIPALRGKEWFDYLADDP